MSTPEDAFDDLEFLTPKKPEVDWTAINIPAYGEWIDDLAVRLGCTETAAEAAIREFGMLTLRRQPWGDGTRLAVFRGASTPAAPEPKQQDLAL